MELRPGEKCPEPARAPAAECKNENESEWKVYFARHWY